MLRALKEDIFPLKGPKRCFSPLAGLLEISFVDNIGWEFEKTVGSFKPALFYHHHYYYYKGNTVII